MLDKRHNAIVVRMRKRLPAQFFGLCDATLSALNRLDSAVQGKPQVNLRQSWRNPTAFRYLRIEWNAVAGALRPHTSFFPVRVTVEKSMPDISDCQKFKLTYTLT